MEKSRSQRKQKTGNKTSNGTKKYAIKDTVSVDEKDELFDVRQKTGSGGGASSQASSSVTGGSTWVSNLLYRCVLEGGTLGETSQG